MVPPDPSSRMPWEPDPDTVSRLFWGGALFFLLIAIVSAVGEILGWWDLVGELGITIGGLASLVLASLGTLWSASRTQATQIHDAVASNGRTLSSVDLNLASVDRKLDKLDDLDVVQAKLDAQTGVLGVQLSVLEQIRDRL